MMLGDVIDAINKKTISSKIFYVTYNAERAVGVEDILAHYVIIDGSNNYTAKILKERGIAIHSIESSQNISVELIRNPSVKDIIKKLSHKEPAVIFFKISTAIEKAAQDYTILNPSASIAKQVENKISQYRILKEGGFENNLPKTYIERIPNTTYEQIVSHVGTPFVAQLDIGHSGNTTFFVSSKEEYNAFYTSYAHTNILSKFTEKLDPIYITINGVATQYGTYVGGLCDQITGLTEIGAKPGETCGNNWFGHNIKPSQRNEIASLTEEVGRYLYSIGYKGFFGIDLAYSNETFYIIEINSRQTQSIQHHAKLQIEEEQIPLPLIHMMEFLHIPFTIPIKTYSELNTHPYDASSLILRNQQKNSLTVQESYNGLYDVQTMKKEEDAYCISDIYSRSKLLILQPTPGTQVREGEEYLKIIARGDVLMDTHTIDKNIYSVISTIQKGITYS